MRASDFFIEEEDPEWDLKGLDPERRMRSVLDVAFIDRLRGGPQAGVDDIEAAYGLARLANEELEEYGTRGIPRLSNEQITAALRTLRAVLRRLDITLDLPFRDFTGFRGYWSEQGMSGGGGWAARRGYLSGVFNAIFSRLDELDDERTTNSGVRGVDRQLKNIIFASTGPKPEIVLQDAINNVIKVTRNAEFCLVYDRPLQASGLTWGELVDWWRIAAGLGGETDLDVARALYGRLLESMNENEAEQLVFRTYCERYRDEPTALPALLPQVYLHYDPLTLRQRGGRPSVLMRERMDFLLLFPQNVRVVIEVDGRQHYAEGNVASPRLYGEMMAEDRRLRLRGYEVYRFGGFELVDRDTATPMLRSFFDDLLARYAA
jgi:very-short-patch-repair endonuclease